MTETKPPEIRIDTKKVSIKARTVVKMRKLRLFILRYEHKITYKKFEVYIFNAMFFLLDFFFMKQISTLM